MSAMHWEARRRQAVLDRRSRSKQAFGRCSYPERRTTKCITITRNKYDENLREKYRSKCREQPHSSTWTLKVKEDPPQPIPKEQSGPEKPTQPGEERGCVHCNGEPSGSVNYAGTRMGSRYNSIQYVQQW